MKSRRGFFLKYLWVLGGCVFPSFFIGADLFADTVMLKNGKEIKGLVVEKHVDRIILSTERGEIPVLLSGIRTIEYDDAEQNFFAIAKAYESEQKYGEALAFYEKALQVNPNYDEARKAAAAVRNRFWAASVRGPAGEVEKKQVLYDAWESGQSVEDFFEKKAREDSSDLKDGLGIALEKKGDWVTIRSLESKKPAAIAGLRVGDKFATIDGESLRYLGTDVVTQKLLEPRFSNFALEIERAYEVSPSGGKGLGGLGLELRIDYPGLTVHEVKPGSPSDLAGLKTGDLIVKINDESTRYLPMKKVSALVDVAAQGRYTFLVRRSILLSRR